MAAGTDYRVKDGFATLTLVNKRSFPAATQRFPGAELYRAGPVPEPPDLLVEFDHPVDVEGHAALGERGAHAVRVAAEDGDVDHGVIPMGG